MFPSNSTSTNQGVYRHEQQHESYVDMTTTSTTGSSISDTQLQLQEQEHQLLRSWRNNNIVSANTTSTSTTGTTATVDIDTSTMVPIIDAGTPVTPITTTTAAIIQEPGEQHIRRNESLDMTSSTIQSPPLAQVVLDGEYIDQRIGGIGIGSNGGGIGNSSLSNFPVANFVTNLVRSSIDTLHATTIQAMDRLGSTGSDTVPLYIRTVSDNDPSSVAPAAGTTSIAEAATVIPIDFLQQQSTMNYAQQQQLQHQNNQQLSQQQQAAQDPSSHYSSQNNNRTRTNTAVSTVDPTLTEYVVVDGEIIAIAPQTPTQVAQYQMDTLIRQQRMESNNLFSVSSSSASLSLTSTCQPKKVKGGVRRMIKLFRSRSKGKKSTIEQQQQQHNLQSASSSTAFGDTSITAPTEGEQQQQLLQQQKTTTTNNIATQELLPVVTDGAPSSVQLESTANAPNSIDILSPQIQQDQLKELYMHDINTEQNQQPDQYGSHQHQQHNNSRRKGRGTNFWKEKSKESNDSNNSGNFSQYQQQQQQSETFSDLSRREVRQERRQARRWGAGRRGSGGIGGKKPPPTATTTTPPRSQDFTTTAGTSTSNNINTNDGYEMFLVPTGTNNSSTQNGMFRGNELLPVDTGLMAPVTSSMSMLQPSVLPNQRNHLNSIDSLSFASTGNTATYHDQLNHSTDMNDFYLDRLVFDRTDMQPPNDQYEASVGGGGGDILMPLPMPSQFGIDARAASVTASFVGVEEITAHAHNIEHIGDYVPGQSVQAESFLEAVLSYDDYGDDNQYSRKKDECDDDDDNQISSYFVPKQYEKLDKAEDADAPDLDIMLLRAKEETRADFTVQYDDDDDSPPMPFPAALSATSSASTCLKSDGASVVLSEATPSDAIVHNDILKVIMVSAPTVDKSWLARALRNFKKRARNRTTLAVDVQEWKLPCPWKESKAFSTGSNKPSFDESESDTDFHTNDVKCMIWDIQGAAAKQNDGKANFAVHPATQSLFFSAQSLYILVWDLACDNEATYWQKPGKRRTDDSDSDEDDDYDDQDVAKKNRQADRILHADIFSRVLSWVDYIAEKGPLSGILPVALIPENMSQDEVQRRIDTLQSVLEMKSANRDWPKMLTATDSIIRVQYRPNGGENRETIAGINQLQDLIAGIAHDSSHQVFSHVGTPVPDGTVLVLDCIRRFKQEHKLIPFYFLECELGSLLDTEHIINALHFLSSIGEIMYFGHSDDEVLSKFIVLSRTWLVSALSCILRNDLKRELIESRGFMNLQSFYDGKRYEENEMIKALNGGSGANLPLLSDEDAKMLWQNLIFMREAADRSSRFEESALSGPSIFNFLEKLLVDSGIFLPLQPLTESETKVFFVPSLLVEAIPTNIWTYKNSDAYKTILCHSWLFRDGAPSQLMEHIVVKLLRSVYDFSIDFPVIPDPGAMQHARTDPLTHRGMDSFMASHNSDQIGSIRIRQLLCWKSSFSIIIDSVYVDTESGQLKNSSVEMFVGVCGQSSGLCVSTEDMHPGMQRVIVSGKGLVGHHAKKLWKGGYRLVLDTIRSTLSSYSNVDEQVICPDCLQVLQPRDASTFMWNSVYAAATGGTAHVHCMKGHRVDTNLMCGTHMDTRPTHVHPQSVSNKDVGDVLQGVVIVGLWDPAKNAIVSVGSGFIVNRKIGLIVSAGHTLFTMKKGEQFGAMYMGIPNARVVVGVIVDNNHTAAFRYWAEIITHEIHRIDACVLRIVSRMNNDVADDGAGCATQPVTVLTTKGIQEQNLTSLKITKTFEIQESIRILGFNQGGEGIFEQGTRVNRVADVAMGYVCRKFEATQSDSSSTSSSSSTGSETERLSFTPQKEIVAICSTISGHSGGPCVNNEGKVIGILSRSDPVEKSRCYLVPATELKSLINQARAIVERY